MNKKRKSLDDALASEFVYGQKQEEKSQPPSARVEEEITKEPEPPRSGASAGRPKKTATKTKKKSIMSRLQQDKEKEPTVRLTVDLSQSMHRKLSVLAAKTGKKKAEIIRFLLDEALEDVED